MTIEIKELVIKASVNRGTASDSQSGQAADRKDEIISDCVEQVLKIIQREKER